MRAIIKREIKDFLSRWNVSNTGSQDFFNHRLLPFSFRIDSFFRVRLSIYLFRFWR